MKRFAVSAVLAILCAFPLAGQQKSHDVADSSALPPTRAQVVAFMEVMEVRQRLQSTVQAQQADLKTTTHNMFNKALPDATPAEKAKFEAIVANSLGKMFSKCPFDDVLRDMIPIYQSHFSESDLKQIISFYSSTVGRKVLKEMPAMSAEVTRVSLRRLQPQIDETMKNVGDRIREMMNEENGGEPEKPEAVHP
jgi:hypothetical protein